MSNANLIADYVLLTEDENSSQLTAMAKSLELMAQEAIGQLSLNAKASMQGSAAKGTSFGTSGDIDIFITLPLDTDPDIFENVSRKIAAAMNVDAVKPKQASHPYVTFRYHGFNVDLVPCYEIESISEMKSAVDRTPLHTAWFDANFDRALRNEVKKLKAFFKGTDVYGADTLTNGFSGYACEVLIHKYGSFVDVMERLGEDRSLPDPVDPDRDVLASVSQIQFAAACTAANTYVSTPDIRFFRPSIHVSDEVIAAKITEVEQLGYDMNAFEFTGEAEELAKTRSRLQAFTNTAREYGFSVDEYYFTEDGKLTFTYITKHLPAIRLYDGPKVDAFKDVDSFEAASEGFRDKHVDSMLAQRVDTQWVAAKIEPYQTLDGYMEAKHPDINATLYDATTPSDLYMFRSTLGGTPRWAC